MQESPAGRTPAAGAIPDGARRARAAGLQSPAPGTQPEMSAVAAPRVLASGSADTKSLAARRSAARRPTALRNGVHPAIAGSSAATHFPVAAGFRGPGLFCPSDTPLQRARLTGHPPCQSNKAWHSLCASLPPRFHLSHHPDNSCRPGAAPLILNPAPPAGRRNEGSLLLALPGAPIRPNRRRAHAPRSFCSG